MMEEKEGKTALAGERGRWKIKRKECYVRRGKYS